MAFLATLKPLGPQESPKLVLTPAEQIKLGLFEQNLKQASHDLGQGAYRVDPKTNDIVHISKAQLIAEAQRAINTFHFTTRLSAHAKKTI